MLIKACLRGKVTEEHASSCHSGVGEVWIESWSPRLYLTIVAHILAVIQQSKFLLQLSHRDEASSSPLEESSTTCVARARLNCNFRHFTFRRLAASISTRSAFQLPGIGVHETECGWSCSALSSRRRGGGVVAKIRTQRCFDSVSEFVNMPRRRDSIRTAPTHVQTPLTWVNPEEIPPPV